MERKEEIKILKEEYLRLAEKFTPDEIKNKPIFDLNNSEEIKVFLTRKMIENLKLEDWLENYEKEAKVSTAGIRGSQNILYPWDTRFPINQVGVALATLAKGIVLKEDIKGEINKIVSGEVRYNTSLYVDLISRIQAAAGIKTHVPFNKETVPVWMVSFLIFMFDYDGGEFVTSSHAISSKTATKDLDNQGNQFLPEMSLRFIEKIKEIIKYAKKSEEGYLIKLSSKKDSLIIEDFNGYEDLYVDYLRKNVASLESLDIIKKAERNGFKIMYDTVGGCMGKPMEEILKKLDILDIFEWRNKEEDPFFHGVGKAWRINPKNNNKEFFDYSCDFCLFDVVKTANFEYDLKDKPIGYIVLMTDPDGDRLSIGQIESKEQIGFLEELGADYISIDENKIFVVYNPTYGFLLIMDFYRKQLESRGLLKNHPRFIVVTAPSPKCWNEWAIKNGIKVVTTPVGMKEIAFVIEKTEKQILENPDKDVIIEDIFGEKINLGKDPRMIFGGEESGGMIIGLENFIESKKGRKAFAMRNKSAGESSIIATALSAFLFLENKTILKHLKETFETNDIKSTKYFRDDIIYYNESEPDPIKLLEEKLEGEKKRDKTDIFYLSIALALKDNLINITDARAILKEVIPNLNFEDMIDLKFTGDAVYFGFSNNLFLQIRRSGTDAKMRGYAGGPDKERCLFYLDNLLHYLGERSDFYEKKIPQKYRDEAYAISQEIYKDYLYKGL